MSPEELPQVLASLVTTVAEMREDLREIKAQTIRTNGRVSEIEVQRRIDEVLVEQRAAQLEREAEVRAADLAVRASRSGWRRWLVNTLIAGVGVAAGVVAGFLPR